MVTLTVLADFSPASTNALDYALALANQLSGRQQPVHVQVISLPDGTLQAGKPVRRLRSPLPAQLAARLFTLHRLASARVACSHHLLPRPDLATAAELLGTDYQGLLVVGRPTASAGAEQPVSRLIQHLQHPLLVVPETYTAHAAPRRIALDIDCQPVHLPASAANVVELLLQLKDNRVHYLSEGRAAVRTLLAQLQPEAVGIHVYSTAEAPVPPAGLAESLSGLGLLHDFAHTVHTACHASIGQGVIQAAVAAEADLLLFVARQQTLRGNRFATSTTAALMDTSPVPALAIPEAAPVPWTRYA